MTLRRPTRYVAFATSAVLASAAALTGCRKAEPQAPAEPAPPQAAALVDSMTAAERAQVTASYDCGDGNRIDVLRDIAARIALSDGRVVTIDRVGGSTPPTFMGNGLTLTVPAAAVAELDDETGRTLDCRPAATP